MRVGVAYDGVGQHLRTHDRRLLLNLKVHQQSESRGEHVDKGVRGGGVAPLKGGGRVLPTGKDAAPSL